MLGDRLLDDLHGALDAGTKAAWAGEQNGEFGRGHRHLDPDDRRRAGREETGLYHRHRAGTRLFGLRDHHRGEATSKVRAACGDFNQLMRSNGGLLIRPIEPRRPIKATAAQNRAIGVVNIDG
jgi:hypothetical protein